MHKSREALQRHHMVHVHELHFASLVHPNSRGFGESIRPYGHAWPRTRFVYMCTQAWPAADLDCACASMLVILYIIVYIKFT